MKVLVIILAVLASSCSAVRFAVVDLPKEVILAPVEVAGEVKELFQEDPDQAQVTDEAEKDGKEEDDSSEKPGKKAEGEPAEDD